MKNIFLILLIAFTTQLNAQQSVSILGAGDVNQDMVTCMHRDQNGNVYILTSVINPSVFNLFGTTIINPYPNNSIRVLCKLNPQMNLLWVQSYKYHNTNAFASGKIAVDEDQNIYVTDETYGAFQIGPFIQTYGGLGNVTFKTDSMGNPLWMKTFSGEQLTYRNNHLELIAVSSRTDSIYGHYISNPASTVLWIDTAGNYMNHLTVNDPTYEIEHLYGRMNNGNYFGIRRLIDMVPSEPLEMFTVDSAGNHIYDKMINYCTGSLHIVELQYDSQNNEFVYFGTLGDQHPLDSIEHSSPWMRLKIIKLDSLFYLKNQIDFSEPGPNIGTQDKRIAVHNGEVFFGGAVQSNRWSHIGYLHPHGAADPDQIIYGKLDKNLEYKWHCVWPQLYYVQNISCILPIGNDIYFGGGTVSFTYDSISLNTNSMDAFLFHAIDLDTVHAEISGTAFVDGNMNGIRDGNENGNQYHGVNNSSSSAYSVSDLNGDFKLTAHLGQNIVRSTTLPRYWANSTPDSISVFISSDDTIVNGLEFGIYPLPDLYDLQIDIQNLDAFRPGFSAQSLITFKNDGVDTVSGTITLYYDTSLTFDSSSIAPVTMSADSLRWDFMNMLPGEVRHVAVWYTTKLNTWGQTIQLDTRIDPVEGDTLLWNNFDFITSVVVAAVDPNDKQVSPACGITENFVASDEPLEYTIRFQNTGDYFAQNVMITDTLSDKLDLSTFELVAMSHQGNVTIEGQLLKIEFMDIMLPDSGANYELSQGYVKFSIQPIDAFITGDIILNQASIIFDFNDPVITNQTSTSILQLPFVADVSESDGDCGLVIQPSCGFNSTLYSIDGQLFSYNNRFDNLVPGPYNLWMIQQGDTIDLGIHLLDSCTMVSVFDIYSTTPDVFIISPNPATDEFTIYHAEDRSYSFQIFNALGEIIASENNCKAPQRKVSVQFFDPGIYFVKIKSADEENTFQLIKF